MDEREIKEKIESFLNEYESEYIELHTRIEKSLKELLKTDEGIQSIYRLTDRRDYQDDDRLLKTNISIYENFIKIRKKNVDFSLEEFLQKQDDIIGFRLICIYPTDMEMLDKFIRNEFNTGDFEIYKDPREKEIVLKVVDTLKSAQCKPEIVIDVLNKLDLHCTKPKSDVWTIDDLIRLEASSTKRERGYRGINYGIRLKDQKQFKCEIQVLTMLHETWAFKTHDNIYKGEKISEEHSTQAKLLSDALAIIDEESELLKDEIRKNKLLEARHREILYSLHDQYEKYKELLGE